MCDINISTIRLRDLIDNSGRTREFIAKEIGCDTSTVTKHYNGDRKITVDYIIKYAKYFNVSSDYLLGISSVKTLDKDIQFICDYTGLEERTVKLLNLYKNTKAVHVIDGKLSRTNKPILFAFKYLNKILFDFNFASFYTHFIERKKIIDLYQRERLGENQNPNHLRILKDNYEKNIAINTFVVTEKHKKIYEDFCNEYIKVGDDNANNPKT